MRKFAERVPSFFVSSSFSKSLSPSLRIGFVAAGRYRPVLALQKTITSSLSD